jgi:hypothetical protein
LIPCRVFFPLRLLCDPPSPIQWIPGALAPGHEPEHSPPFSAEIKNAWSYTSTPQYVFMAWCLVKHRDNYYYLVLRSVYGICLNEQLKL